ncbi:uncharacterized protein PITG_16835 [Phytophthora infestans T30-4]|uniref:Uncharacterized protein n=1 Tax=Phytophthora infestans (strain T30-4) TaxID=403677 RepID=D0NU81_PHYIT|nr:uncharacterized protein PITG_16835 [Phytophthora infestans T30-4]EEY65214.1 hypothetical protein PITG_16835 [Phytophthora infestans T30-4]|eukprot:XP_002897278.1 hypothetical protein PITG_16835 [Phytophthora infestans T30-4]
MKQAEEQVSFAQSTAIKLRGKQLGRDVVNNVHKDQTDICKYYKCGMVGYLAEAYPSKKKEWDEGVGADVVLTIDDPTIQTKDWILDSGSSRHLDGRGATAGLAVRGEPGGEHHIAPVVRRERVQKESTAPWLINGGPVVLDVKKTCNVLLVLGPSGVRKAGDVLLSVLAENEAEVGQDVQTGTLIHSHRLLCDLDYDTIINMAKDPASGIALTDELRANCLACAQGKQTHNKQS